MTKCLATLIALCCLLALPGAATTPPLQHASWSTEEGLPQSSVHAILQSQDGFLWLATEGGLARYDGVGFKLFGHESDTRFTSNDITSLAEMPAGTVWIGTADGLLRLAAGQVRRFTEADGLPANAILALAPADDGSLLLLTAAGVARFDGTRMQPLAVTAERLDPQPDGSVVLAGGAPPLRYSQGRLAAAVVPPLGEALRGLTTGPDRTPWAWTDHEVVAGARRWRTGVELPGTRILSLLVDRQGVAWIGTNRGLASVGTGAASVTRVEALGANAILCLFADAEGDLWIGTETSGLHALRPRALRAEAALGDEQISAVVQTTDGAVWAGTRDDGLRRLDHAGSTRPVANSALTSPFILSLAAGLHRDLWAGTPDGLNHVSATGQVDRYTSSDGLPDDLIRSLLVERDGGVWAGTRRGLAHLHRGGIDTLSLPGDLVGTLANPSGTPGDVWIGTLAGVTHLHGGRLDSYGPAEGLASNLVTALLQDRAGRLWAASRDRGLFRFKGSRFLPVNALGLPSEIDALAADPQGFLWLRTRRGIVRVSAEALAACSASGPCSPDTTRYGAADGMPSEELVANGEPAIVATSAGELWFATRKGVAVLDPARLPLNTVRPPVSLERFLADTTAVPLTGEPSLQPGYGRYTFEYAGLSFTLPAKVRYRSMLEGFDGDWTPITTARSASYTNLPAGRFRFRVQAANNDGLWSDPGAAVSFRVLAPFYRRWSFYLLLLAATALLGLLLYRLRVRQLQRRFSHVLAERNRIAREIHDTLAQDFVGVAVQLDVLAQHLARPNLSEAAAQLKATRALVKTGLEAARQGIWNLRANTTQKSLPARLSATLLRFAAEDPALTPRSKIGGAYRPLPRATEEELLRIAQEAISNVSRHARAAQVTLDLHYGADKLVLTITDDGGGFSPEEAAARPGHFGLQGMRERALAIAATLAVHSSPGAGTTLTVSLPIPPAKEHP